MPHTQRCNRLLRGVFVRLLAPAARPLRLPMNPSPAASSLRLHLPRAALLACALWLAAPAWADEVAEVQRLQRAGQTSEALARADKYIAAKPRDPQMRFIKAGILSASGRQAEAETLLTQLTRDYPELAEPWNNLAVLHAGQGLAGLAAALQALHLGVVVGPGGRRQRTGQQGQQSDRGEKAAQGHGWGAGGRADRRFPCRKGRSILRGIVATQDGAAARAATASRRPAAFTPFP